MAISGWLEVSRRLFSKIHIQIKTKSSNVTLRSVEDFIIGEFNFKQNGYLVCGGKCENICLDRHATHSNRASGVDISIKTKST